VYVELLMCHEALDYEPRIAGRSNECALAVGGWGRGRSRASIKGWLAEWREGLDSRPL
jgi:hypothetical protein